MVITMPFKDINKRREYHRIYMKEHYIPHTPKEYNKTCISCNKEFKTNRCDTNYCSQKCYQKEYYSKPEQLIKFAKYRQEHPNVGKEYYQKNREHSINRAVEWRRNNVDKARVNDKNSYEKHREERIQKSINYSLKRNLNNNHRIQTSKLCKYAGCPRRVRIEIEGNIKYTEYCRNNGFMKNGTIMHRDLSSWARNFDRLKLRYDLLHTLGDVFTKSIMVENEQYVISGIPDDYRVIRDVKTNKKYVSILEFKTTFKKRMWSNEIEMAKLQLMLYIWIMRPYIEQLGYTLWKRHWLEIYSQKSKRLIRRVPVYEDIEMDKRVKYMIEALLGLHPITLPPEYLCKHCPEPIKDVCGRYGSSK